MKTSQLAPSHFDESTLSDLRARLPDYLEAVGVELRKNGTRLVGRCPVHEDRSPSFAVFGTHHETCGCYPCGFTGDIFAASKWLGRSSTFPEAVQDVAALLGVLLSRPAHRTRYKANHGTETGTQANPGTVQAMRSR